MKTWDMCRVECGQRMKRWSTPKCKVLELGEKKKLENVTEM